MEAVQVLLGSGLFFYITTLLAALRKYVGEILGYQRTGTVDCAKLGRGIGELSTRLACGREFVAASPACL